MRTLLMIALLVGVAHADPTARFGLTFGVDRNAPEAHEVGPMFAVGASLGRFTGEASYTYLSFFDGDTSIHRVGVALRAEIVEWCKTINCNESSGLYGEVGAGRRAGQWAVDPAHEAYATKQNEMHLGFGYQLATKTNAWQLGLRLGVGRRDPMLTTACRGVTCPVAMPASTGLAESAMLEWMFLLR